MAVQERVARPAVRSSERSSGSDVLVTWLFGATAFFGAGLLFVVQPLVARLLLPSYGGSATVWSTSSLFFQTLLLLGYLYVHWSTTRLGRRWQPRLHLPLLLLPMVALPLALPADAAPAEDAVPALWLLRTLLLLIGLPFIVVTTTGPVLQRWYSWSSSARAQDPYFLFAASNAGSFVGLLAYPFLIEPFLPVGVQLNAWSLGFVVFAVMTACCAVVARVGVGDGSPVEAPEGALSTRGLPRSQVLRWIGLAFLPSSMMLGVTAHLSTDVAAVPLLWVVPLAIYLATFVLAFRSQSRALPVRATRAALAVSFVAIVTSLAHGSVPVLVLIGVNLAMLALVGYAAHARLAAERPDPAHLTAFYLVISIGGAMGGLLNGLLAPTLFDRVLEYPLALIAVPLLMIGTTGEAGDWLTRQWRANRTRAALVAVSLAVLALLLRLGLWLGSHWAWALTLAAVAGGIGWLFARVPVAVLVAAVVLFASTGVVGARTSIEQTRTFFGSYTVTDRSGMHQLVHGTTLHGTQFTDEERRGIPTTYYSRSGPLGDVLGAAGEDFDDVAVVGLGVGTVAAYGRPGQTMTFVEIDPGIVDIARDPDLFSYLADSEADIETVVGDGRLRVAEYPAGSFDLLALDAFSSDSIPVHLLTREAFAVYASRVRDDGLLVVHISNRVFDLEPVVAAAAEDLGWSAAIGKRGTDEEGSTASGWVALSDDPDRISRLLARPGWQPVDTDRTVSWTDDYSSILSVLR